MSLCHVSPQIWQKYLIGFYTLICWILISKIAGTRSSFLLILHVSTLWFFLWQFVQYIPIFSVIIWGFTTNIVLLFCGINRLFIASTLEIPSSQTKGVSLYYYKVSFFMPNVATHKYGCNPDLKIVVRKLFVVLCWRLLANFNNLS